MDPDFLVPIAVVAVLFVGFPWLIFHYITKWKTAKTLTNDDEKLLDDLYEMARRLDDRMCTIERIMTAENPDWQRNCPPATRSGDTRLIERIEELESNAHVSSRRKVK